MATKVQHEAGYQYVPKLLLALRTDAGLTQRDIGSRLKKPQSWVYNCETGNRRVDVWEFEQWANACEVDPIQAFKQFLKRK